jgi:hypothetical protein
MTDSAAGARCTSPVSTEFRVRDMRTTCAITDFPPHMRRKNWQDIVSKTYFLLDISFAGGSDFTARLERTDPGFETVRLSGSVARVLHAQSDSIREG